MNEEYMRKFFEELRLRNVSMRTIRAYSSCVRMFLRDYSLADFEPVELRKWIVQEHLKKDFSASSLRGYKYAFECFSELVLGRQIVVDIPQSKKAKKLPVVLSRGEIERILNQIKNEKHGLMVALAYGAGLRISEVLSLRVSDICFDTGTLHLKEAKGRKDRITMLPSRLKERVMMFVSGRKGGELVFPSERGGKLSSRSLQKIFERAKQAAGITKPATFHSLRHSFATHLIEQGTNLRYVQSLLGHSSIRTTQVYTKVAKTALMNIESPF